MFRISKPASRFLSLLLAVVMVFGMFPVSAFAADAVSYEKASSLENGATYVIVADGYAMTSTPHDGYTNNTNYSYSGFEGVTVTTSGNNITNGVTTDMYWKLVSSGSGYTVQHVDSGKYLSATYTSNSSGSGSTGKLFLEASANDTWSLNGKKFVSKNATNSSSSEKQLTYDNSPSGSVTNGKANFFGIRSSGDDITFYKVVGDINSGNSGNGNSGNNGGSTTAPAAKDIEITTTKTNLSSTSQKSVSIEVGQKLNVTVNNGSSNNRNYAVSATSSNGGAVSGMPDSLNIPGTREGNSTNSFTVTGKTAGTVVISLSDNSNSSTYLGEITITITGESSGNSGSGNTGSGSGSGSQQPSTPATGSIVVIAGSDMQAGADTMNPILNQVKKNHASAYGVLMAGDYSSGSSSNSDMTSMDNAFATAYPDMSANNRIYIRGNHDSGNSSSMIATTGAHDTDYYGVYAIGEKDGFGTTVANNLKSYLDAKIAANDNKPIFVVTHKPLHKNSRNDNTDAINVFNVLNNAGEAGLNIIFLFGHNHSSTYDDYIGGGSIYLPEGDEMMVGGGSGTYELKFTYMNPGYVGYCRNTNDNALTMTAFEITNNQVTIKRYDTNGVHVLKAAGTSSNSTYPANTTVYQSPQYIALSGDIIIPENPGQGGSGDSGSGSTTTSSINITSSSSGASASATINAGDTLTINLTNGSSSNSKTYTVTSGNTGVAQVTSSSSFSLAASASSAITVKGIAAGTTTIEIYGTGSGSAYSATINLTVKGSGSGSGSQQPGETLTAAITMQKENSISSATISKEINVGDKLSLTLTSTSGAQKSVTTENTKATVASVSETSFNISANGSKTVTIEGLTAGSTKITFKGSSSGGSDYYAVVNLTVKGEGTTEPSEPETPDTSKTVHNIGFESDVHSRASEFNTYFTAINKALSPDLEFVAFGGDYADYANESDAVIDQLVGYLGTTPYAFTYGNHEYYNGTASSKYLTLNGVVDKSDVYDIFMFGATEWSNDSWTFSSSQVTALSNYLKSAPTDQPIFVVSHLPLHYFKSNSTERYATNALEVIELLNQYPNVIFIWGHTHSQGDPDYGKINTTSIKYSSSKTADIKFVYASNGTVRTDRDVSDINGLVATYDETAKTVTLTYYNQNAKVVSSADCKTIQIQGTPTCSHTWQDATCTAAKTCTKCGATDGEALGHDIVVDKAVAATCTATGLTEGEHCSRCDDATVAQTEIAALGHTWDEGVVTKEPTKAEPGIRTYTCGTCGETKTEEIPYEDTDKPSVEPFVERIAGANRVATALAVATELKEVLGVDKFDAIIIAAGGTSKDTKKFADALSGSYLASIKNAPILLYTSGNLAEENLAFIKDNLSKNGIIYLLGGEAAVPAEVSAALSGYTVKRLKGNDRYETNRAILNEAGLDNAKEILIATGDNFADCLSASATGLPIMLVKGSNTALDAQQIEFLNGLKGKKFTILGGTAAVSAELEAAIEAVIGAEVERIQGEKREETSTLIAKKYFADADLALIAYSKNYPDGLAGGVLANALGAPLLLTNAGNEKYAAAYIEENDIDSGYILGGTAVISNDTANIVFGLK